ncbi:hypothetical protein Tco_0750728 [Tanacetum coccineum]|uniref:Retrovirus-related Pol polyprotein from transposon TNT 1-94-like beta-barrel domain-containing protein n=1 Tax=Tanacetum coccineum TaxID=301880 RepID=A0ABQ4Z4U1_9ASTR
MVHHWFSTNIITLMHEADPGFIDSGCSRHMTGNIAHLSDFKDFNGGYVTFGGGAYGGRITGTSTIKTGNVDFDDILLKIPRHDNMYSFAMKNIVPKDSLTCLVAKATSDRESMLGTRRLCHSKQHRALLEKGIKREYSCCSARTSLSKNCVVKRKNWTLIEGLIVKPHNKTPYELLRGFKPAIGFMKHFGCHVTILTTLDNLGKFDEKSDEATERRSHDGSSLKENGTADPQVNTAKPDINTGSREVSTGFHVVNTDSI